MNANHNTLSLSSDLNLDNIWFKDAIVHLKQKCDILKLLDLFSSSEPDRIKQCIKSLPNEISNTLMTALDKKQSMSEHFEASHLGSDSYKYKQELLNLIYTNCYEDSLCIRSNGLTGTEFSNNDYEQALANLKEAVFRHLKIENSFYTENQYNLGNVIHCLENNNFEPSDKLYPSLKVAFELLNSLQNQDLELTSVDPISSFFAKKERSSSDNVAVLLRSIRRFYMSK